MTAENLEQREVEALWLSYPEAQKLSGLGRTKLWEIVSSGEIKAARIGRAVRISRRSLEDYMERRAEGE
jgi:excisionase family DNA binding protein